MTQSYLRTALTNIHRDPAWWRTVLRGGAYMLTFFGWPLASGLVVENMENATKGYPTPLPPWVDLGTRYIIGIFALMIDFVLFLMPLFVAAGLLICAMVATLIGAGGGDASSTLFRGVALTIVALVGLFEAALFLLGTAPVARLKYVEEGRVEDAIGSTPVRQILRSPARHVYLRARVESLPVYLPFALLLLVGWGLTLISFPGQFFVFLLLAWLALSALLYAHLAVAQVYALAQEEVERIAMEALMPR
jgi:hypothetical protein